MSWAAVGGMLIGALAGAYVGMRVTLKRAERLLRELGHDRLLP